MANVRLTIMRLRGILLLIMLAREAQTRSKALLIEVTEDMVTILEQTTLSRRPDTRSHALQPLHNPTHGFTIYHHTQGKTSLAMQAIDPRFNIQEGLDVNGNFVAKHEKMERGHIMVEVPELSSHLSVQREFKGVMH